MHKTSTLDRRAVLARTWKVAFWSCAAVVLVLSLIPAPEAIPGTGWDVSNHGLAFSVLAILGFRAYPRQLAAVVVGLVCFGILIEILQSFVPYRFAEWKDLVADCSGIAIACSLEALMRRFGISPT